MIDFTLPELGENVTSGEVLRVLVKPGDTIEKEQPVVELETDKATIEVPSSVAGRVSEIKVKTGDTVSVGQAILSVEDAQSSVASSQSSVQVASQATESGVKSQESGVTSQESRVGSQESGGSNQKPVVETSAKRDRAADKSGVAERPRPVPVAAPDPEKVVEITRGIRHAEPAAEMPAAPASPSVRRMARELGVDINQVTASGSDGRISIDDVKAHAKRLLTSSPGSGAAAAEPLPDFSRWGEVERQPLRPVRRKTAEHLSAAWTAIPHVTQHDVADITALEELRKRYSKQIETSGGKLTTTAIAVKVIASALKAFPRFNASIDMAAGELVLKKYVNVGVAVDTDRGLLVPVIRNADTKNIGTIAVELAELAEKARTRKLSLEEMQGGSISISNLGGIGGTLFTPIVNLPEVAILGISRARTEPVWRQGSDGAPGEFQPRLMLPLSLSYDHRVIDGADGARFLRWVAEAFEQPFLLLL